ncbi:hypothetical protein [Lysinibacillus fusiformis]|uniref:hypothetical protein n=1 Tax=Lysinibacillus fusiformis TaxID=28031 RepID=UPI000B7D7FD8|nr:hypothetical protein [Lysinibacillus fusiformis]
MVMVMVTAMVTAIKIILKLSCLRHNLPQNKQKEKLLCAISLFGFSYKAIDILAIFDKNLYFFIFHK